MRTLLMLGGFVLGLLLGGAVTYVWFDLPLWRAVSAGVLAGSMAVSVQLLDAQSDG